jgi:DNA-binding CsgD family transcriptional regulator
VPVKLDPLRIVEACYASGADDATWLRGIVEAAAPLDRGLGLTAATYRIAAGKIYPRAMAAHGALPERILSVVAEFWESSPPEMIRAHFCEPPPVALASRLMDRIPGPLRGPVRDFHARCGIADALAVSAVEPDDCGVKLMVPLPDPFAPAPRTSWQLARVSAHLLSGHRLRRSVAEPAGAPDHADAILRADGKVEHAAEEARRGPALEHLVAAVRRAERARGRLRRTDPDEALALWRGLVDGRWSLVDHCDSDGRRFVLARRNEPRVRDVRALTPRERDVAAFVARGHSNKYVAYALGLAAATVAAHLASALAKLGVGSRRELIALLPGAAPQDP